MKLTKIWITYINKALKLRLDDLVGEIQPLDELPLIISRMLFGKLEDLWFSKEIKCKDYKVAS